MKNTLPAANGGLGVSSPTAHCVVVGAGTSAAHLICPVSSGYVLTDNGISLDPTFQAPIGGEGTGNVTTSPAGGASQILFQPVGTDFTVNSLNRVRNVPNPAVAPTTYGYNWLQFPSGSLTGGTPATVTLTPCPLGVNGADTHLTIRVGTVGTAEDVAVTGGTCVGGATSGTVVFTPANSHGTGFSLGSDSTGIYEAYKDATAANVNGSTIRLSPSNPPGTDYYTIYPGAMIAVTGGLTDFDCQNATLDVESYRAGFFFVGGGENNQVHGCRVASKANYPGAVITNTACAGAGVVTITTALNPVVGSTVDIQATFNHTYWGPHQVTSTSGSSWTYTIGASCPAGTSSQATAGGNDYQNAFVESNSQETRVYQNDFDNPSGFSHFPNHVAVVDNDQAFHLDDTNVGGVGYGCTLAYCPDMVYAPGPFGINAAVVYVKGLNSNLECAGNGITAYAGNTVHLDDTIIQGISEWSINTGTFRGGYGQTQLDNVYSDGLSCPNPLYSGGIAANVGLFNAGGNVVIRGGEGPGGVTPQFASTGDTNGNFYYYQIVVDSVLGKSMAFYCGHAYVDSTTPTGSISAQCPRVQGTNTVTYDELRCSSTSNSPLYPYPGSTTGGAPTASACGSVATGIAQVSTPMVSFTDTASASSSAYTYAGVGFEPWLWYWPGTWVNTTIADTQNPVDSTGLIFADAVPGSIAGGIISEDQVFPTIFGHTCSGVTPGTWVSCMGGSANNTVQVGATLLQVGIAAGGEPGYWSGRLGFLSSPGNGDSYGSPSDFLTIAYANPWAVIADALHRPLANAADTAIGIDVNSGMGSTVGLALRAPVSISSYINTLADGTSWLERMTATAKIFKLPTGTTPVLFATLPTCSSATEGLHRAVTDSTTNTWGATITGLGGDHAEAYCDGTNWTVAAK